MADLSGRRGLKLRLVPSQTTIDALFRLGVPQGIASDIAAQGFSLAKLREMDVDTLQALGLERRAAERILDSHRPPFPLMSLRD